MTLHPRSGTSAERRGVDLSSAPEHVQVMLNRIMYLEDENERLRGIVGDLYERRGSDATTLRAAIRSAFGESRP